MFNRLLVLVKAEIDSLIQTHKSCILYIATRTYLRSIRRYQIYKLRQYFMEAKLRTNQGAEDKA